MSAESKRYAIPELKQFATALLEKAGMDADKSAAMARLLVLTDAMGRRTHGMAMLLLYLKEIQSGGMQTQGTARQWHHRRVGRQLPTRHVAG
jgi:LDH2 family malate/lactate/ureidoglycolate dehydrogenase